MWTAVGSFIIGASLILYLRFCSGLAGDSEKSADRGEVLPIHAWLSRRQRREWAITLTLCIAGLAAIAFIAGIVSAELRSEAELSTPQDPTPPVEVPGEEESDWRSDFGKRRPFGEGLTPN